MSRMLMFSSIGVILFSLAAGTSWYLQYKQQPEETPRAEDDKPGKGGAARSKDPDAGRPVVRAPLSPEADRLTVMSATLQTQQQTLRTREQQLTTREKQLDLIHDEIKKEHKKLESVRKQVDAELQIVQEKLDLLEKKSAEGEKTHQNALAQVEEARRVTLELSGMESKNLKQVAGIYDKMDADAAAQSIQQMVDKGKIDTAVTILTCMRDRQAANLLGIISNQDASIATQLFDRMRYMKTPAGAPK